MVCLYGGKVTPPNWEVIPVEKASDGLVVSLSASSGNISEGMSKEVATVLSWYRYGEQACEVKRVSDSWG